MRQNFPDVIKKMFDSYMNNINTAIPGLVENYDPTKQRADVKPAIKKKIGKEIIAHPVIVNVPVQFMGSGNATFIFPLAKGDRCLIIFSQESMENYLSSPDREVDPGDSRRFSIADAICIPMASGTGGLTGIEIIFGSSKIVIDDTGITLGSGDAAIWKPSILPNDPFTGLPHGGPTAGIAKLRGA